MRKELQVAALENGTAIDHIPTAAVFKVVSLLQLQKLNNRITIGNNLKSSKMGAKGIIKVSDKYFREDEVNRIALVAPNVNLNIINNFEIIEKKNVELPDEIIEIVRCNNPKCITNNEPMPTLFHVVDKDDCVIKCHYCEKEQTREDIEII